MGHHAKIVIIEKDLAEAAKLSLKLGELGHVVKGIFSRPKEALSFLKDHHPDIVLLHENLKGQLNGMEIMDKSGYPVVYFNKNLSTGSLVDKLPVNIIAGRKMIKERIRNSFRNLQKKKAGRQLYILEDRIFVRNRDSMIKISLNDIQYIEADRNYCKIHSRERQHLLVSTLKDVDEKLKDNRFLRVHRSYIVNLSHLDEVGTNHLLINNKIIPLSKSMRGELLKHLQVI